MNTTYFSNQLYEVLIRHLVDDKKVLPVMVEAAKHDDSIRRDVEALMIDELYKVVGR